MKKIVHVAAAVIRRKNQVLICSRPADKPPAGWEFPGGKFEPGENAAQAAKRELLEELKINITPMDTIFMTDVDRGDRIIRLHFVRCILPEGEIPVSQESQEWRIVPLSQLSECDLLPSDKKFSEFLQ